MDITIFNLFFSGHRFMNYFSIIKDNEPIQIGKNKPIQNTSELSDIIRKVKKNKKKKINQ